MIFRSAPARRTIDLRKNFSVYRLVVLGGLGVVVFGLELGGVLVDGAIVVDIDVFGPEVVGFGLALGGVLVEGARVVNIDVFEPNDEYSAIVATLLKSVKTTTPLTIAAE